MRVWGRRCAGAGLLLAGGSGMASCALYLSTVPYAGASGGGLAGVGAALWLMALLGAMCVGLVLLAVGGLVWRFAGDPERV